MSPMKKMQAIQGKENAKQLGYPVASKNEVQKQEKNDLFGFMAGQFEIVGDIMSPIEDWSHWDPAKNLEE